jgi:hypothetical protein
VREVGLEFVVDAAANRMSFKTTDWKMDEEGRWRGGDDFWTVEV